MPTLVGHKQTNNRKRKGRPRKLAAREEGPRRVKQCRDDTPVNVQDSTEGDSEQVKAELPTPGRKQEAEVNVAEGRVKIEVSLPYRTQFS